MAERMSDAARRMQPSESRPRLRLSGYFKEDHAHYATLSHCWGAPEKRPPRLTRSNLANYLLGIPIGEFPKTFLDAIKICSNLDIRYIWIDSLCIIQDEEEDWAKECTTMANVYGGGLLNIAASSASDGSQGCFFERKNTPSCRFAIELVEGTNDMYDCITSRHPLQHSEHNNISPLETRGWALQERFLSPRTVYFTSEEVFWECHTKFVSESSPFQSDRRLQLRKGPISMHNWYRVVWEYSSRKLTYERDKLIALVGIVEKFQRQTNDEYCAGMWKTELIWQLCWEMVSPGQRLSPPRAPTWSWASVNRKCYVLSVSFHFRRSMTKNNELSKILKMEKLLVPENTFGDVPNAILWLECPPLLAITIDQEGLLRMLSGSLTTKSKCQIDCLDDSIPIDKGTPGWIIYALRIVSKVAILLRPTNKSQGEYKRIGLWKVHMEDESLVTQVCRDETYHAKESAYVPKEKHKFDTDGHVIALV